MGNGSERCYLLNEFCDECLRVSEKLKLASEFRKNHYHKALINAACEHRNVRLEAETLLRKLHQENICYQQFRDDQVEWQRMNLKNLSEPPENNLCASSSNSISDIIMNDQQLTSKGLISLNEHLMKMASTPYQNLCPVSNFESRFCPNGETALPNSSTCRTDLLFDSVVMISHPPCLRTPPPERPLKHEYSEPNNNVSTPKISSYANLYQQCVGIHLELKKFRKYLTNYHIALDLNLKKTVSSWRHEIQKWLSQVTCNEIEYEAKAGHICEVLNSAFKISYPTVDIRKFLFTETVPQLTNSESVVSAVFIYMVNIFSKMLVNQFIQEAGVDPQKADGLSQVAASIFRDPLLLLQGKSLSPIFICKFVKHCPVLFGEDIKELPVINHTKKSFFNLNSETENESLHYRELTIGVSAGLTNIILRQPLYPYPLQILSPRFFWSLLSHIVNHPVTKITPTHLLLLRAMLSANIIHKFLQYYGRAALVAVKTAVISIPSDLPQFHPDVININQLKLKLNSHCRIQIN